MDEEAGGSGVFAYMEAVFRSAPAGPELGVEAADLGSMENVEGTPTEATGVMGVRETDVRRAGRDPETPQCGDDVGAFTGGREHGRQYISGPGSAGVSGRKSCSSQRLSNRARVQ